MQFQGNYIDSKMQLMMYGSNYVYVPTQTVIQPDNATTPSKQDANFDFNRFLEASNPKKRKDMVKRGGEIVPHAKMTSLLSNKMHVINEDSTENSYISLKVKESLKKKLGLSAKDSQSKQIEQTEETFFDKSPEIEIINPDPMLSVSPTKIFGHAPIWMVENSQGTEVGPSKQQTTTIIQNTNSDSNTMLEIPNPRKRKIYATYAGEPVLHAKTTPSLSNKLDNTKEACSAEESMLNSSLEIQAKKMKVWDIDNYTTYECIGFLEAFNSFDIENDSFKYSQYEQNQYCYFIQEYNFYDKFIRLIKTLKTCEEILDAKDFNELKNKIYAQFDQKEFLSENTDFGRYIRRKFVDPEIELRGKNTMRICDAIKLIVKIVKLFQNLNFYIMLRNKWNKMINLSSVLNDLKKTMNRMDELKLRKRREDREKKKEQKQM